MKNKSASSDLGISPAVEENASEPAPEQKTAGDKKKKGISPLARFLIKLTAICAIAAVALIFFFGAHIHHGNNMHPYLMDGDLLVTYKLGKYNIGDAVLYRNPVTGETGVSRIVALGNSEINISANGEFLLNGITPGENVFYPTYPLEGSTVVYPYRVSTGQVFLLDDFRTQGVDSRAFGAVSENELLGKVSYVIRRRGI